MEMGRGLWVDCTLADSVGRGRGMAVTAVVSDVESDIGVFFVVVVVEDGEEEDGGEDASG